MNDWQIPNYKIEFESPKTKDWCIVIPVIDEGERIRSLLDRMFQSGSHNTADIIIIDGGSTDDSLREDVLTGRYVNTLLTKIDDGKLSAQLRCAYAFAINKGYRGIVTIDGNDKDDPESLPLFIAALEQGVDFAQGSRFIDKGVGENTPLSRELAIRLLHAPLLRLSSGFKWTDTTQGYRAYSTKMLTNDNIQPFRSIFRNYELLAYLSYRVPKVGLVCLEIPTKRTYPQGEVPTKISGLKGNLELVFTLVKACLGGYNPPKTSSLK